MALSAVRVVSVGILPGGTVDERHRDRMTPWVTSGAGERSARATQLVPGAISFG